MCWWRSMSVGRLVYRLLQCTTVSCISLFCSVHTLTQNRIILYPLHLLSFDTSDQCAGMHEKKPSFLNSNRAGLNRLAVTLHSIGFRLRCSLIFSLILVTRLFGSASSWRYVFSFSGSFFPLVDRAVTQRHQEGAVSFYYDSLWLKRDFEGKSSNMNDSTINSQHTWNPDGFKQATFLSNTRLQMSSSGFKDLFCLKTPLRWGGGKYLE